MERSPYAPMKPSSEAPNPLRPYYRPPSIGLPTDGVPQGSAGNTTSNRAPSSPTSFMADIDYNEILGTNANGPSTLASLRALADQLMWKYTSVFLAQPFEVAKMVLQVRCADSAAEVRRIATARRNHGSHEGMGRRSQRQHEAQLAHTYEDASDSEEDEMSYFTSTAPSTKQTSRPMSSDSHGSSTSRGRSDRSRRRRRSYSPRDEDGTLHYRLDLRKSDSLMEVIGQLWQREGAWGIWKGTNVTFLQNLLVKTIEIWTRGALSALMNVPDASVVVSAGGLGGLDILDSPAPFATLGIAVAAAGLCGLLLAPLDAIRTRIMLTPTTSSPRSIIPCLRAIPSYVVSPSLILPTLLHSTLPTIISTSSPLFVRSYLRIDPIISPTSYSICTFFSSVTELFVKLPIETVLRRGQIHYISQSARPIKSRHHERRSSRVESPTFDTVVEVGPYTGIFSTMWRITREEGITYPYTGINEGGSRAPRKGQGVPGLFRGWKVGMWALVGLWGTTTLSAGGGMGQMGGSSRGAGTEF